MFIGHHAVALAAKPLAPRTPLTLLLAAALFLDLLWPLFLLAGTEQVAIEPGNTAVTPLNFVSYPYTHSLLTSIGWGVLFGGVYFTLTRERIGAVWLALLVVSHWVLDFASHRPDLPLFPGDARRYGLGLWYSIPATMIVEILMFAAGILIYLRATRPKNRWGTAIFAAYVFAMLLLYVANIFGPPPPTADALAKFALIAWIIIPWAYGIDVNRISRAKSPVPVAALQK